MNNYNCIYCGQQCKNGKSYGAHLTNCKSNPRYQSMALKRQSTNIAKRHIYSLICHKCEKQYNLDLTESQFNSGKYRKHCSIGCANSRIWSDQDKLKKSISAKHGQKLTPCKPIKNIKFENIIICAVCNIQFKAKSRKQRFCSRQCVNQGQKLGLFNITKKLGGYRAKGGRGKQGWYKGIYCNSSWQLAYVMYCKDHNIDIKRNNTGYQYLFEDVKPSHYYPDFIINGQQFVQVKGFKDARWQYKMKYFPYKLKVIDGDSINYYLSYAKQTYGANFVQLYE